MSYSVLTCREPATPEHALPLTSLCSSNTAVSAPSWALTWDYSLPQKIRYPKLATCVSSSSSPNICSNVTFLMKSYLSCLMPSSHPGASSPCRYFLLATYHHLPWGRRGGEGWGGNYFDSFSHSSTDKPRAGRYSSVFSLLYPIPQCPEVEFLSCNGSWMKESCLTKVNTFLGKPPPRD